MSGTSENSTEKPKEEEIPLNDDEPALLIKPPVSKRPEYYECDTNYRVFDSSDSD